MKIYLQILVLHQCPASPNQICFLKNSNIFFLKLGRLDEQVIDVVQS